MPGLFAIVIALTLVFGRATATEIIYDTKRARALSLEEFAASRAAGEIIVLGEQHARGDNQNDPVNVRHHENQMRLLSQLTEAKFRVFTGMEFLTYPVQPAVDDYLADRTDEATFLKAARWGGAPFTAYRAQIRAPRASQGRTLALNSPSELSRKIAKGQTLTPEDKALLPPLYERGQSAYYERFLDAMGEHAPSAAMERYFMAQSLWDDTMAWKAQAGMSEERGVQVIIVGEFHAEFGHGLPARLRRRGVTQLSTMLQVALPKMDNNAIAAAVAPDAKYGPRADYVWVYEVEGAAPLQGLARASEDLRQLFQQLIGVETQQELVTQQ